MKKIYTPFFLLLFSVTSFAQTDFKKIDCKNPIIGDWMIDSTMKEPLTILDSEMNYIDFSCSETSTTYSGKDEDSSVILPVYFTTKTNGKTIKGVITESLMDGQKGKTFSFDYKYDAKKDTLTLIYEGKEYTYYRLKK